MVGNNMGQNGAEGQLGTTRVPHADVLRTCLMVLGTR